MDVTKRGTIESSGLVSQFYVEEELKFMSRTSPNVYNFETGTVKQQKVRH